MTPGTFRVAVHRMRRRFRSFLENEVARTVDTEADLKEEIAYLLHVMGTDTAEGGGRVGKTVA
jgi:RNA polymerase sigma-70 factor (ECF subfamily)